MAKELLYITRRKKLNRRLRPEDLFGRLLQRPPGGMAPPELRPPRRPPGAVRDLAGDAGPRIPVLAQSQVAAGGGGLTGRK